MKAKLIKERFDFYGLKVDDKIIATNDVEVNKMLNYPHTLSLKNCQAIENGYDLGDLVKHYVFCKYWGTCRIEQAYADGFNQALKILGDKKFSESDVREAIDVAWHDDNIDKSTIIQSLQPTEWDVIIETECVMGCQNLLLNGENSVCCGDKKPKLDTNNCLILKRVEL